MKVICIGRNYYDHIEELGNEVNDAPVVFFKYEEHTNTGNEISIPEYISDIHYECELVFKFKKDVEFPYSGSWRNYIDEVTLGLDLTARTLQTQLKSKGLPWDIAKNFKNSAVIGKFHQIDELIDDGGNFKFDFYRNNKLVQNGDTSLMIYNLDRIIAYVQSFIDIKAGDVLFTGTPKGVGQIHSGDEYVGSIFEKEVLHIQIL